jgi:hypothetical protein
LTGETSDQAALIGILNSLYNLGFPLRVVEYQSIVDSDIQIDPLEFIEFSLPDKLKVTSRVDAVD